jgi:hypothetical protein
MARRFVPAGGTGCTRHPACAERMVVSERENGNLLPDGD